MASPAVIDKSKPRAYAWKGAQKAWCSDGANGWKDDLSRKWLTIFQAATVGVGVAHIAWSAEFARHEVSRTRLSHLKQSSRLVRDECVVLQSLLMATERCDLTINQVLPGMAPSHACKLALTNTVSNNA